MVFRSANFDLDHDVVLDPLCDLYGISVVFDVRSTGEQRTTKSSSPSSILAVSLFAVELSTRTFLQRTSTNFPHLTLQQHAHSYIHTYIDSTTAFISLFEHIRDKLPQSPLLVHCELGRDRTGVSIAVLLFVLGVYDDSIVDDYALSNEAVKCLAAKRRVNLLNAEFMKNVPSSSLAIERHFKALPDSMRCVLALPRDTNRDAEGNMLSIRFGLDIIQNRRNLAL